MNTLEDYILKQMKNRKFAMTFIEQSLADVKKAREGHNIDEEEAEAKDSLSHALVMLAKAHGVTLIEVK